MAWTKDWTIETVENNYKAIGMIDPEDIEQLIEDAKLLARLKDGLGRRDFYAMLELADEQGERNAVN